MFRPRITPDSKTCVTCRWFDFDPAKGHYTNKGEWSRGNRECLFQGKITTFNGLCQQWHDPRTLWERIRGKQRRLKSFC